MLPSERTFPPTCMSSKNSKRPTTASSCSLKVVATTLQVSSPLHFRSKPMTDDMTAANYSREVCFWLSLE